MDELYCNRSFADSGSHSFHRTVPHIAHGEETWNIGLEQEGIPVESPSFGTLAVTNEIGTGQQEATLVSLDQSSQPIGSGQGPDEDEHRTRGHPLHFVRIRAKHGDFFQMGFTMRLG